MLDKYGRKYAKMSELEDGSIVQVDDGFTCLSKDEVCVVREDEHGLYIGCSGHGDFKYRSRHKRRNAKHYLDGQLGDIGDSLIGVYLL